MESISENRLKDWLKKLKERSHHIVDEIIPYEYTIVGYMTLGKEVSLRHIKMAIFGNLIQMSLLYSLAYFVFPDKATFIIIFSLYLGAAYTWYILAKLRYKRKWSLIESLEAKGEEWRRNLKSNPEYQEKISDIVHQHRKLLAMNNYHSLKDVLINRNTDISDGKHLFITKESIDNDIFGSKLDVSHIDLLAAMNKVALESVLEYKKASWTHESPGSANIVMSPLSNEFMHVFEDSISKIIESLKNIVETAPELKRNKSEPTEEGIESNVVNLFTFNGRDSVESKATPHLMAFTEVARVSGLIADVIEPLVDRFKLSTVDQETERKLLSQAQKDLESLSPDIENIYQKSKAISGR